MQDVKCFMKEVGYSWILEFSNCKHQLPVSEGEEKAKGESWTCRAVRLENYGRISVEMTSYKYTRVDGAAL